MNFSLSTEEKLVQKTVREFTEKEIAPVALDMENIWLENRGRFI